MKNHQVIKDLKISEKHHSFSNTFCHALDCRFELLHQTKDGDLGC